MPGIFGIISKRPQDINEEELKVMSKSISMEKFYNSGRFIHAEIGVYIGWTCHKGSFSDCLPVTNEKKDIIFLYFGENFKNIEEIDDLKGRNHVFSKWNASYIVHMYEEWGENFLLMLNGCFHGILIDKRKKKAILFNDRYGIQRMYYAEKKDAFYFSAEAKAILKIISQVRHIEIISLGELFLFNYVLDNRSLFKKVYLLPGGSRWTFYGDGIIKKETYFDPSVLENQPLLEKEFHYERLRDTFQNILKRYFKSTDKIGMFLTGGLDCLIMLANAQYGEGKIPCYTLNCVYGETNDVQVSQRIAEVIGQTLQVIKIDDDFFQKYHILLEKLVYISEGNSDAVGTVELYLNQIAREIAPIRMSCDWGGTFLRKEKGMHLNKLNRSLFNHEFQNTLNEVHEKYNSLSSFSLVHNLNKGLPWSGYGNLNIRQSQLVVRTPFLDNDFVNLIFRALDKVLRNNEVSFRLINDGNPLLTKIGDARGIKTSKLFSNCNILNWIIRIKKYCWNIECKRRFLSINNSHHFRIWYRHKLSDYVKEILLDERSTIRFYINKASIEHIVTEHLKGKKNYTLEISKLLIAEFVHRLFIDDL